MNQGGEYKSLAADQVLWRDPELRLASLADGRILVRHLAGTTLRAPIPLHDLQTLLAQVDGIRTVAEICTALEHIYRVDDVNRLLANLVGNVLHTSPPHRTEPRPTCPTPEPPQPAPDKVPKRVCILGGGTAGYLTALALLRKMPHLQITLIEARSIPIIGVGEATTPLLPQFLHCDLGLDMVELFREVKPTFKLGIRFLWGGAKGFNYPFGANQVVPALHFDGNIDNASLQSMMMRANVLPMTHWDSGPMDVNFGANVAYHLDNRRFVAYLRRKADERGITHLDCRITDVRLNDDGEIAGLCGEDGRQLSADFYVDCSGFRSLLVGKTLHSPFLSFEKSLFTDRALTAKVSRQRPMAPHTRADSMSAGWCWNLPQQGEDHIGYVFSSRFIDPERATQEMRNAYPTMSEPRLIEFRSGRRTHFWKGNAVAMGNAYGFVEPLESTALHMIIRQIGMLLPILAGEPASSEDKVNQRLGGYWDYLCWFLAIHYRFNGKLDTPFWQTCRQEADVSSHAELIELFQAKGPLSAQELPSLLGTHDPLWGPEGVDVILAGLGLSCPVPTPQQAHAAWSSRLEAQQALVSRALDGDKALAALESNWADLAHVLAPFTQVGPAFPWRGN